MNTDPQASPPPEDDEQLEYQEDEADTLIQLLEELDSINESPEDAALNKFSMDDNNGGRIEFMKRLVRKLPAFLLLRRLIYAPKKTAKSEQGDGA